MKKYEFVQKLSQEDLINYNYFVAKNNKSTSLTTKIMGVVIIALGVYSIIIDSTNYLWANIIVIVLGLISVFVLMPLLKLIITIRVKKIKEEMKPIKVIVFDKGIGYCFIDEEVNETTCYLWDDIKRVIETKDYFYVYFYNTRVALIKKENIENLNDFKSLLNEKINKNIKKKKKNSLNK